MEYSRNQVVVVVLSMDQPQRREPFPIPITFVEQPPQHLLVRVVIMVVLPRYYLLPHMMTRQLPKQRHVTPTNGNPNMVVVVVLEVVVRMDITPTPTHTLRNNPRIILLFLLRLLFYAGKEMGKWEKARTRDLPDETRSVLKGIFSAGGDTFSHCQVHGLRS